MAGDDEGTGEGAKTFTQEEVDALLKQRIETEVAGLKANRDEALRESKAARDRLKAFDGIDPEEHRRLRDAAADAAQRKAQAEGDFKALEKQLIERHQADLKGKDDRIAKYSAALEQELVDARISAELAKAELVDPTFIDLLKLEARRFIKVKETDEGFSVDVTDGHGNRLVADGNATPMDVATFVQQTLKTKYPAAFKGTGSSGGGASKSGGGAAGTPQTVARDDNAAFLANLDGIAKGKVKVR